MSELSNQLRIQFKQSDDRRDAGLTTPADIQRFDDIIYGNNAQWQKLDVYRPRDLENQCLPVLINVHGGGWVYGDKERYQYYCMSLAQQGFAVINFTYRLSPEFKFPAPLIDTNLVMKWVLDHQKEYGFDAKKIVAVGDSAGAHILAMYANLLTNPDYAHAFAPFASCDTDHNRFISIDTEGFHIPKGAVLYGVGLNCGQYQMDTKNGTPMTIGLAKDYFPGEGNAEEVDLANIPAHMTSGFPCALLMTCPQDFLQKEPAAMIARMTELQVSFEYRYFADEERKLAHIFHCNVRDPYAVRFNKEECNFLKGCVNA